MRDMNAFRARLIDDMKNVFGTDQKRIDHALTVLDYAEQIQAVEGGDIFTVQAAAILHDIGINQAEQKYGSSSGKYQEIEGPPIARAILIRHGLDAADIEHVCTIIANHHSARNIDTLEFRILWDADWLVNIPDEFPAADRQTLRKFIDKIFKTESGRQIAQTLFLTQ